MELERQRQHAAELLERTKLARQQKKVDEDKARQAIIEDQRAREEVRRKLDQRRELELLFSQAQIHFEREQYGKCIDVCDRILYIDPRLNSVDEMKMIAQRLNHVKSDRDATRSYIEQWKRTFENVENLGTVQADELSFPARELWLEVIRRRRPKGILGTDEGQMSEADLEVMNKIRTIQINLDFQNADIRAVIDYVREISGLNIVIDGRQIQDPSTYTYPTLRLKDVTISAVFDIVLGGKELAYSVESGVIVITTAKAVKAKVKLDMYNVQDITYGLQDFPGVNITLSEDALGHAIGRGRRWCSAARPCQPTKSTPRRAAHGANAAAASSRTVLMSATHHACTTRSTSPQRPPPSAGIWSPCRGFPDGRGQLPAAGGHGLPRRGRGARRRPVAGYLAGRSDLPLAVRDVPRSDGGGGARRESPGITGTFDDNIVRNMGAPSRTSW